MSNYDLEMLLGIAPPAVSMPVSPTIPAPAQPHRWGVFGETLDQSGKPELDTWLPQPKTASSRSWIVTSRKRLRHLNVSTDIEIPYMDRPELEQKAKLVQATWTYCSKAKSPQGPRHRDFTNQVSLRKLARLASESSSDITYNYDLSFLVCRAHNEVCALQGTQTPELSPLGWIPFHARQLNFRDGHFTLGNARMRPVSMPEPTGFCAGSLNRDETGRWFLDTMIEVASEDMRMCSI